MFFMSHGFRPNTEVFHVLGSAGLQQNLMGLGIWRYDLANPGIGLTKYLLDLVLGDVTIRA